MQGNFWAKSSGISLVEHTNDVLEAVDTLHTRGGVGTREEWWLVLRYAALLHDLGKIDPCFQAMLHKRDTGSVKPDIPHSLLSLFLFRPELLEFDDPTAAHIVVSAVAFHHWRETFPDLFMGSRSYEIIAKAEEFVQEDSVWSDRCKRVVDQMKGVADRHELDISIVGINNTLVEYLRYGSLGAAGILVPPYTLTFLPETVRGGNVNTEKERFRIFVAGNLIRADHFASLVEESGGGLKIEDIQVGEPLSQDAIDDKLKAEFKVDSYWQQRFFVARPKLRGENLILVAPTGFGKTEFAYLWGAGIKNLMLLPMRAATNKIFDRVQGLYGKKQTALLHGDASLELFIRAREKRPQASIRETEGQRRKALDLARHLAKPYIVATADQIVPSALRYPGYERIFSVLMDSGLIIDEVQAYDPRAAAIVTHLLQQNAFLGGKILLMTATLPPFIKKEIVKRVGLKDGQIVNLLKLTEFTGIANSVRHRIQFVTHDGNNETVVGKIVDAAAAGQKVLVIMNTVFAARGIYEFVNAELKRRSLQINRTLLHSRFTVERRKKLETLVADHYMPNQAHRDQTPCIVVSTQIVEASLNIDADILFTETAPADSLVQRMGRVYRRYAHSEGNNAPESANVFVMVEGRPPKKGKRKSKSRNDAPIASGIGKVYNRALTVVSLALLAHKLIQHEAGEVKPPVLYKNPWAPCFRKKKGRQPKGPNNALYRIIHGLGEKTLLFGEEQKIGWVNHAYNLLDEADGEDFPLDLGDYIKKYRETLEILDHGYCSDKRRDAMRLFRDINDITGIPNEMADEFYKDVNQWVKGSSPWLNYAELATSILPKYLVSCPYRAVVTWKGVMHYRKLDLNRLIPSSFSVRMQDTVHDKLERWLSGLVILELPYDAEKGLDYFAP